MKGALIGDPDEAMTYLAEVLDEIKKTFLLFENVLQDYLSIWFDPETTDAKTMSENRRKLIALEGGMIRVELAEARGHCSKIPLIYEKYLKRWFKRALEKIPGISSNEQELENLFTLLEGSDWDIIKDIGELANFLEERSSEILADLGSNIPDRLSIANSKIETDRTLLRDKRRELTQALEEILGLKHTFIELTKPKKPF